MIYYTIWGAWFLSEILINLLLRSGKKEKKKQDRGSVHLIWISILIANTAGISVHNYTDLPIGHSPALGMILRFFSIASLGKFFTVDVAIREEHVVKQDGIYKILRHPSYTGMLVTFMGFGISLNNWLSALIIIISVMIYRIHIEEKLRLEEFGVEYSFYMKHTKRLIPWIY